AGRLASRPRTSRCRTSPGTCSPTTAASGSMRRRRSAKRSSRRSATISRPFLHALLEERRGVSDELLRMVFVREEPCAGNFHEIRASGKFRELLARAGDEEERIVFATGHPHRCVNACIPCAV